MNEMVLKSVMLHGREPNPMKGVIQFQKTPVRVTKLVVKKKQYQLYFDGVDDYVGISTMSQVSVLSNYTITGIFKAVDVTQTQVLFTNQISGTDRMTVKIVSSTLRGGENIGGASWQNSASSGTLVNDTLYFFSYSHDGSLYINNTKQTGTTDPTTSGVTAAFGAAASLGTQYFKGIMIEVRIYNINLSAAQVASLYGGADLRDNLVLHHDYRLRNALDRSGQGNNGTIYGAVFQEVD